MDAFIWILLFLFFAFGFVAGAVLLGGPSLDWLLDEEDERVRR